MTQRSYTIYVCPECGEQGTYLSVPCQHFDPDERYIEMIEVPVQRLDWPTLPDAEDYPKIICTDELSPRQGAAFLHAADLVIRAGVVIKDRPGRGARCGKPATPEEIERAITITREQHNEDVRRRREWANAVVGRMVG